LPDNGIGRFVDSNSLPMVPDLDVFPRPIRRLILAGLVLGPLLLMTLVLLGAGSSPTVEIEATVVDAPRVADAPVAFECSLYDLLPVGASTLVLGEVERVHVDDEVTTGGQLDVTKLDAVGRLSGSQYARTNERFSMERPP